jgi:hypothetical protein
LSRAQQNALGHGIARASFGHGTAMQDPARCSSSWRNWCAPRGRVGGPVPAEFHRLLK